MWYPEFFVRILQQGFSVINMVLTGPILLFISRSVPELVSNTAGEHTHLPT